MILHYNLVQCSECGEFKTSEINNLTILLTIISFTKFMAQEFSEIEFFLVLTFFISLHSQLSSIHSIVTHSKKGDSSNRQ